MNIFVGNLLFGATQGDVKKLFESFGSVVSVRIVMEKKGNKSRGFGFVQMPDEQQALAAISALNGKEFMGRVLNVNPARPKPAVEWVRGEAKKIRSEIKVKSQEYHREEGDQKRWYNPVFNKEGGRYKTGRRSQSFMKRHAVSGVVDEAMPKPLQKSHGEPRSWKKTEGESKPWKKKDGEFKPWRKRTGEPKPRRKGGKRPRPRQSRIESRRKPGGYKR